MECKVQETVDEDGDSASFNRDIVECKEGEAIPERRIPGVLIET